METFGDVASDTSPVRWPNSTPSAARRSSAWPVTAESPSWRLHRLQLTLSASGCGLRRRPRLGVRFRAVEPDAAHRVTVAGLYLTYPAMDAAAIVVLLLAALGAAVLFVVGPRRRGDVRAHRRPCARSASRARGGRPGGARDRARRADRVLRRLAATVRLRVDRRAPPASRPTSSRPSSPTSVSTRRCAIPCGWPSSRAVAGAVLPPGAAPAARALRRRRPICAPTRPPRDARGRGQTARLGDARLRHVTVGRRRRHLARGVDSLLGRPARGTRHGCRSSPASDAPRAIAVVWRAEGAHRRSHPQPPGRLLAALPARAERSSPWSACLAGAHSRPRTSKLSARVSLPQLP